MNTAFEYCYRDAANWKRFRTVIFAGAPDEVLRSRLTAALQDELWFIAEQVRIPTVFFEGTSDDDHCWHELLTIAPTPDATTDDCRRSFAAFVAEVEHVRTAGWHEVWPWQRR